MFYCSPCSNGNAAGNTLEEAILQGFLELVERDAVAIWWYNTLRRPSVDLSTFSERYVAEVRQQYRQVERDVWVLDITTDLRIPAFAAVSSMADGRGPILLGFGCHPNAGLAVQRALTEMTQMFLVAFDLDARSDGLDPEIDWEALQWMRSATLANQPHVVPNPTAAPLRAADYETHESRDIRDDVLACQEVLERHGLEMLILDQTRPDIGLSVVKVVVPGLRHFWGRFAPGRLYDVPVRMGWLTESRREEELNSIPIFF